MLVLDAGALSAVERCDRDVVAWSNGSASPAVPVTSGGVAQVWRGGCAQPARIVGSHRRQRLFPADHALARANAQDPLEQGCADVPKRQEGLQQ
jgi:hypothetical protein